MVASVSPLLTLASRVHQLVALVLPRRILVDTHAP